MEITSDVMLRGSDWVMAIDNLSDVFSTRTHYTLYIIAMSIGIMYDKRIENPAENEKDQKWPSVPRNVLQNNDNGKLDFMFQAAILSTSTEDFSEEERLDLAFGEKSDYNRLAFLTQFANYGVSKLVEYIGDSTIETMENIKNFLFSTVDGRNLEIDPLPDEILLDD